MAALERLREGDGVTLHSLRSTVWHNGKSGTLEDFNPKTGRWKVKIRSGGTLNVQATNLTKLMPESSGVGKKRRIVKEALTP